MDKITQAQETQVLAQLENDLHELEVNTFEIEDIVDAEQFVLSSTTSSCTSCSSTSHVSLK